jgi:ribonucleoside-diphosphate reductase alpha chain
MPKLKKRSSASAEKEPTYSSLSTVDEIQMDNNAKEIFMRRYALKNDEGKPRETIEEAFYRVASHVADGEKSQKLRDNYTSYFFKLMAEKRFVPNTPTWSGSKTKLGQLAACFVLPILDDMGSARGGIFDTLKNAALIQQTGGGNGFSFSRIRPKGDRVSASNGVASGPVSFLQAYDTAFGQIAQGGTRRGANMAVLRIDHPDVREFIRSKAEEGKISNFNISVGVTDAFMKALKEDGDFDLINPRNGAVTETVKAKELFDEIVEYAFRNGEPGVLFLDAANRQNPVPNQYTLEATNPCGEQWLGPYENCCLGHININASVIDGKMDWDHLRETTVLGTRFLDDVVTQNAYVPAVPELKEAAYKNRRIGLGYMGLADAMYQLGIRYGSEQSLDFASQVTEFIRYHSMLTSIELAREKGAFPGIRGSIYDPEDVKWTIPTSLVEYKLGLERPKLDWNKVYTGLKKFGIRNSTQTTIAPTGTTATVYGLEGYGCEPVFALAYYRNVYQSAGGDKNLQLTYVSPSFEKALNESGLDDATKKLIIEESINKGTIQHLDNVPAKIKNTFVVSADISADEHVWMQSVIQRFIDNSISKTCNFPEDATREDVKKAYQMAWDLGCKGLTVYVTGSRQEVVLETKATQDKKKGDAAAEVVMVDAPEVKRPRPSVVVGRTHKISTPFGDAFVTVNRNGETGKQPFEVFITIGKSGTDAAAFAEALGRLISGWLRSARDPNKALEEVAHQLRGIGGSTSIGFGIGRVSSIPDAVAKVLINELNLSHKLEGNTENMLLETGEDYRQNSLFEKVSVEAENANAATAAVGSSDSAAKSLGAVFKNASVCPECNNMTLIETEGCVKCSNCAYTRC